MRSVTGIHCRLIIRSWEIFWFICLRVALHWAFTCGLLFGYAVVQFICQFDVLTLILISLFLKNSLKSEHVNRCGFWPLSAVLDWDRSWLLTRGNGSSPSTRSDDWNSYRAGTFLMPINNQYLSYTKNINILIPIIESIKNMILKGKMCSPSGSIVILFDF